MLCNGYAEGKAQREAEGEALRPFVMRTWKKVIILVTMGGLRGRVAIRTVLWRPAQTEGEGDRSGQAGALEKM